MAAVFNQQRARAWDMSDCYESAKRIFHRVKYGPMQYVESYQANRNLQREHLTASYYRKLGPDFHSFEEKIASAIAIAVHAVALYALYSLGAFFIATGVAIGVKVVSLIVIVACGIYLLPGLTENFNAFAYSFREIRYYEPDKWYYQMSNIEDANLRTLYTTITGKRIPDVFNSAQKKKEIQMVTGARNMERALLRPMAYAYAKRSKYEKLETEEKQTRASFALIDDPSKKDYEQLNRSISYMLEKKVDYAISIIPLVRSSVKESELDKLCEYSRIFRATRSSFIDTDDVSAYLISNQANYNTQASGRLEFQQRTDYLTAKQLSEMSIYDLVDKFISWLPE